MEEKEMKRKDAIITLIMAFVFASMIVSTVFSERGIIFSSSQPLFEVLNSFTNLLLIPFLFFAKTINSESLAYIIGMSAPLITFGIWFLLLWLFFYAFVRLTRKIVSAGREWYVYYAPAILFALTVLLSFSFLGNDSKYVESCLSGQTRFSSICFDDFLEKKIARNNSSAEDTIDYCISLSDTKYVADEVAGQDISADEKARLLEYVGFQLQSGVSKENIIDSLRKANWNDFAIRQIFLELSGTKKLTYQEFCMRELMPKFLMGFSSGFDDISRDFHETFLPEYPLKIPDFNRQDERDKIRQIYKERFCKLYGEKTSSKSKEERCLLFLY